jgi:hypothetical protein
VVHEIDRASPVQLAEEPPHVAADQLVRDPRGPVSGRPPQQLAVAAVVGLIVFQREDTDTALAGVVRGGRYYGPGDLDAIAASQSVS